MIRAHKLVSLLGACGCLLAHSVRAQTPTPPVIVVQAANSSAVVPPPAAPAPEAASIRAAMKTLQEVKAANDEMLKKQDAALQQLEEMHKAADQLRIFAHRSGG